MGRTLVAVNTAPDSENRMHGDEARRYGFASGLVPGVDVLGYLAHAAVDRWGPGWLDGGRLDGRLLKPVYDGETVTVAVTATDGPASMEAEVVGPDDVLRARAVLLDHAEWTTGAWQEVARRMSEVDLQVAAAPAPADRPPASRELLEPGTVLATQRATFHADRASSYLDEISEDHPAFRDEGLAHPGWLLRFANWALSSTVRLGPWIHVASDAWFFGAVRDGDTLEVRAQVVDRSERNGHELVDLVAEYTVDGNVVAFVDHRAIWQPRTGD
jgi:acyl dehydratase